MATKYKPFLFERRFDEFDEAAGGRTRPANSDAAGWDEDPAAREAEDAEAEEPEAPPAPTFSEEELEAAKHAAYDEGRRDGLEAGRQEIQQEIDAQIADLLEVVSERIAPLAERQKQAHERAAALMAKITRDIFEKLMPAYTRRYGDEEVVGLVADSLANLQDVGRLSVRVTPEAAEPLADRLEQTVRLAGFDGKLSVIADPSMQDGDAALDWGAGGAERRYRYIWAEIDGAVSRAIGDLLPDEAPDEDGAEEDSHGDDADGEAPDNLRDEPPDAPASDDAQPSEDLRLDNGPADDRPADDRPIESRPADDGLAEDQVAEKQTAAGEDEAQDAAQEAAQEKPLPDMQTETTTQDDASGRPPDDQR